MERADWILLALDRAGANGLTPVQIQKTLFLLGERLPNDVGTFFVFYPHNYGPFSKDIYTDSEILARQGLVEIRNSSDRSYPQYHISTLGSQKAKVLGLQASPRALEYLSNVVQWVQQLSFAQLVRAIYAKYPHFRVNSVFSS